MSEIKAGDLVVVVKPTYCCNRADKLGRIFIAGEFYLGGSICPYCKQLDQGRLCVWMVLGHPGEVMPISRLKKIDPLSEPESTEHKEELTA